MTGRTVLSAFVIGLLLTTVSCSTMGHRKKEAVAQYKLGVSQFLAGNNQAAYVRFQEALRLDPNNKEVYNALGNVHLRLKEYEKAEKSFKKAVSLDSQFSEAHNNLCYVYYKTGRHEEAITSCERALANKVYNAREGLLQPGLLLLQAGTLRQGPGGFRGRPAAVAQVLPGILRAGPRL
ncbi:MAG: tetratricopeptide repeat protein [Nitrospirota bacterium]